MDVLSLGKGLKAKKAAQAVSNRLGVDQTKNGPLGIIDVHENVSKRLDVLEEKLKGKTITPIVLSTQEDWKKGTVTGMTITANGLSGKGVWETTIQLPVDAVALDKIILEGTNVGIVEIRTKTNEDYQLVKAGGMIASTFGHTISVKLTSFATTPVIQKLIFTYVTRPINERLSDLSVHTAINLNKQQLRLSTVLEAERYQLTNTVIDDFQDATGIDATRSAGIAHDATLGKISQDLNSSMSEVHFIEEKTEQPPVAIWASYVTNDVSTLRENVDLEAGTHQKTEVIEQAIQLAKKENGFEGEGVWESEIIELPKELYNPPRIVFSSSSSNEKETLVEILVATSNDGVQFSEYKKINEDGFLKEKTLYLQLKVQLKSVGENQMINAYLFNQSSNELFVHNEHFLYGEDIRLKEVYQTPFQLNPSYIDSIFIKELALDKEKWLNAKIRKISINDKENRNFSRDNSLTEKIDLSNGTGGGFGESQYVAPNGVIVTSTLPAYKNSTYYYLSYLFEGSYDNSGTKYWLTSKLGECSLTFDFNTISFSYLRSIKVWAKARSDCYTDYRILASDDNVSWEVLVDWVYQDDFTPVGIIDEHQLDISRKRYIRFEMIGKGAFGSCFNEIEFYSSNLLFLAKKDNQIKTWKPELNQWEDLGEALITENLFSTKGFSIETETERDEAFILSLEDGYNLLAADVGIEPERLKVPQQLVIQEDNLRIREYAIDLKKVNYRINQIYRKKVNKDE